VNSCTHIPPQYPPEERSVTSLQPPLSSVSTHLAEEWEIVISSARSTKDAMEFTQLGPLQAFAEPEAYTKSASEIGESRVQQSSRSHLRASFALSSSKESSPPLASLSELPLDVHTSANPCARLAVSYWGAGPSADTGAKRPELSSGTSSQRVARALDRSQEGLQNASSSSSLTAASPLASRWHCRVCYKVPRDPTATICGHLFCHGCIIEALRKDLQCPVCRNDMLVRLYV